MKEEWVPLPIDNGGNPGGNNIFISGIYGYYLDDFHTNRTGCLILIQGSGDVRAGYFNVMVEYGHDHVVLMIY